MMIRQVGVWAIFVMIVLALIVGVQYSHAQPPSGPSTQATSDEADRLDKIVVQLLREGSAQKALPLAQQSLSLREKALGPRHPGVATSLNNLAEIYQLQGAHAKAEPLYVRALDIREKALGAMHPDVAQSLNNLAEFYRELGAYAKAEPLYARALDIREKALGATHPDVAQSLSNLALLYKGQGAYAKAEPLLVRALSINEKVLGAMHPNVAQSLDNLALLYKDQGAYPKAEPLYVRALAIWEKALGAMHPNVAQSLGNLAELYRAQSAYAKAEPLYVRALDIWEKTLGAIHPNVAQSLNSLAELYRAQDAYGKAEPLLVRALAIWEKTLGPTHPEVAQSLNNLAELYEAQGAYTKAEPLYARALNIREKALGAMHPSVAMILNNLAGLYEAQGAYAKAEPLYARALNIREKALGPMHPDVALSLNDLAALYWTQGMHAKAEPLLVRALDINDKALGAMHPDVARSLNNLAALYWAQGAYAKAEPLLVRALGIHEKALGTIHPDVARSLINLATVYQAQGAYARGAPLLARAAEIREAQLRLDLAQFSAPRKRAVMMHLQGETESLVSLHADAVPSNPQMLDLALTAVLRRKGRALDSLEDHQAALRAHLTPSLRDKLAQLTAASAELSTLLHSSYDPSVAQNRASDVATLRAHIGDLESVLNAASDEFRVQSKPATVANIQAALPHGEALVEFVRYHRFDARQAPHWQEARYVAYILPWQGPLQWVALGKAAPIDAEIDAVLTAMHKESSADATKGALQQLDALVFAPIRGRLANITHVILSPDGKLNLVPFEALIDPQGRYALAQYLVSYVTSGRDLLRLAARSAPRSPVTIVAAPDYGPGKLFSPFDGATAEAKEVQGYFPSSRPLTGRLATKAALAAVLGPAVLHIATHAFYTSDATATATSSTAATSLPTTSPVAASASAPAQRPPGLLRGIDIASGALSLLPPLPPSDDPAEALDRAGLAMAGANTDLSGIVSARELAGYDWWGTQLVVLSACEVGVGAVPSGDGTHGLRRAVVLAGAASQVVSLWSVSDSSTRELMRDYYGELARGTGRAEALRQAKLRLLRQPRYAHPYYWAAFIPAGDWRPLDKSVVSPRKSQP